MFKFRLIKLTSLVLVAMVALAGCFGSPLEEVKETNETAINNVMNTFIGGIKNRDVTQIETVIADQITTNLSEWGFGSSVETISKAEFLEHLQAEFELMKAVHEVRLDNRVIVEQTSDRVNIGGDYYIKLTSVFDPDDHQDELNAYINGSLVRSEGKWLVDKLIMIPYE